MATHQDFVRASNFGVLPYITHCHFVLELNPISLTRKSMFHVSRSVDGAIQSVSKQFVPGGEALDENDPEIQRFFKNTSGPGFDAADADFVRVLEDLIDTLILKNVIHHTDLPPAAQKKLMIRKGLRNRIQGALNLLGNDDRIL